MTHERSTERLVGARVPQLGAAEGRPGIGGNSRLQVYLLNRSEEIAQIVPLIAEAHAESPFGRFTFSAEKARQAVAECLEHRDRRAGFYVRHNGRVVGLAKVVVGPHYLSDEGVIATCLAFFVAASIRKSLLGAKVSALLLRAMKGWAGVKGAAVLTVHGTFGHLGRISRGARPIGVNVIVPLAGEAWPSKSKLGAGPSSDSADRAE